MFFAQSYFQEITDSMSRFVLILTRKQQSHWTVNSATVVCHCFLSCFDGTYSGDCWYRKILEFTCLLIHARIFKLTRKDLSIWKTLAKSSFKRAGEYKKKVHWSVSIRLNIHFALVSWAGFIRICLNKVHRRELIPRNVLCSASRKYL